MRRFAIGVALAVVAAGAQTAQRTEPVEIKNANVWAHRIGEEQVLRLTAEELKAAQRFTGSYDFTFDLVVSESGMVESATPVKNWNEAPDGAKRDAALAIVKARSYKPWLVDGVPVRAKVQDYVMVYPPGRRGPEMPFPAKMDRATLEMGLERTLCFGSCPAYKVTVAGNGTVKLGWRPWHEDSGASCGAHIGESCDRAAGPISGGGFSFGSAALSLRLDR